MVRSATTVRVIFKLHNGPAAVPRVRQLQSSSPKLPPSQPKEAKLAKAAVDAEFAEALRIAKEKQAAEAAAEAERLAAENAVKLAKAKKDLAKSQLDALLTDNDIKFSKLEEMGRISYPNVIVLPRGRVVSGYGAFL